MNHRKISAMLLAGILACAGTPAAVRADTQGVIAVVNDLPVTERDVVQRIALLKLLGHAKEENLDRQKALQSLIDEQVKLEEAKKFRMTPSEAEIDGQVERMASGMKKSPNDLVDILKKQGISNATFRRYVTALIGFNRIIASKYREQVKVDAAAVDRKFAEIRSEADAKIGKMMQDPRMKPVTVYTLMQIELPVEQGDAMASQLTQARAVEATQLAKRFKGCGNWKKAAEGIFNVKAGKKVEADAAKLPPKLRQALEKVGQGGAVGPIATKQGVMVMGFCDVRKLIPPKPKFEMPTREQVERLLINEQYDALEEDYLKTARKTVYVEFRDASYSQ